MTAPPDLVVTLDKPMVQMQLMDQTVIKVSIAPNGYSGAATLQMGAGSLPAGVQAAFNPPMVLLDGTSSATAQLALSTASSTVAAMLALEVDASAGGATARASLAVEVQPAITIHIPAGIASMGGSTGSPLTTAFGPYPIKISAPANISDQSPVTVYFMNDDSQSHEIHADSPGQGFGHDPGPFGGNSMDPYVRNVNTAGTYDFYLHDLGPVAVGLVEIQ
jgi:hypothetical protein